MDGSNEKEIRGVPATALHLLHLLLTINNELIN
jgi:hypothetical protein